MKTDRVLIPLLLLVETIVPRVGAAAEGYTDTPMQPDGKWHVHDPNRPVPKVITPGANLRTDSTPGQRLETAGGMAHVPVSGVGGDYL